MEYISGPQVLHSLVTSGPTTEKGLADMNHLMEKYLKYVSSNELSSIALPFIQGIYHNDLRCGEGVLSYPNGRQDVGIWKGQQLIQLKFPQLEADFAPGKIGELGSNASLASPNYTMRGQHGPKGHLEVLLYPSLISILQFLFYL